MTPRGRIVDEPDSEAGNVMVEGTSTCSLKSDCILNSLPLSLAPLLTLPPSPQIPHFAGRNASQERIKSIERFRLNPIFFLLLLLMNFE